MKTIFVTLLVVLFCLNGGLYASGEGSSSNIEAWESLYERCEALKGQRLKGEQLKEASQVAEFFLLATLDLLKKMVEKNDHSKAGDIAQKALGLLKKGRDPRLSILKAVEVYCKNLQKTMGKVRHLKTRVEINPDDLSARKELIQIYMAKLDDPDSARKVLAEGMDEDLVKFVQAASEEKKNLQGDLLLDLAVWYRKTYGSKNPGTLLRAREYCLQFLEIPRQQETARSYRAKLFLSELDGLLGKALYSHQVEQKVRAKIPWVDVCDVRPGDFIDISAAGKWRLSVDGTPFDADGPGKNRRGCLQARFGGGIPIKIGKEHSLLIPNGGKLQMGMDDDQHDNNVGFLTVAVKWWKLTAGGVCSSKTCILKLLMNHGYPQS